ncbi:hypothetical protein HHE06_09060 [Helicobacter heilmannii]|nr:hypothetical protein HHE06_09060 [Helicobacter heilmannii]
MPRKSKFCKHKLKPFLEQALSDRKTGALLVNPQASIAWNRAMAW